MFPGAAYSQVKLKMPLPLPYQAGTIQLIWGARAARPRFAASGRKLSAATWENCLIRRSSAKNSRRDADRSDRDGPALIFLLNVSGQATPLLRGSTGPARRAARCG